VNSQEIAEFVFGTLTVVVPVEPEITEFSVDQSLGELRLTWSSASGTFHAVEMSLQFPWWTTLIQRVPSREASTSITHPLPSIYDASYFRVRELSE